MECPRPCPSAWLDVEFDVFAGKKGEISD